MCQGIMPRSRAGYGLGAVGGAELAQDMGYVLLDRVERHHQVMGDALIRPARGEQPQHLRLAVGQRLGQARRRGRESPPRRGVCRVAGAHQRGQVAGVDAASRGQV